MLAAMASFYLSTTEAHAAEAMPVTRAVLDTLDGPAGMAMVVFRTRLAARRLAPGGSARGAPGAEIVLPAPAERAHN
jgi:hypothetical protein